MRLLIDLFACQSASRKRGLGRYAGSVAQAILEIAELRNVWLAANGHYVDGFESLRRRFTPLLPPGRLVKYYHQPRAEVDENSDFHEIAAAASTRAVQMLSTDIAWSPSPFEGWNELGNPLLPASTSSYSLNVATVHDFIPLVFPGEYLDHNEGYKKWYLQRLALLLRCDLLIADSESTRRDALRYLGVTDNRIVTVPLAADPFFTRVPAESVYVQGMLQRLGIRKPFILFTGNADFRKNVDGMLSAFLALPDHLRASHQLVFTQVGDPQSFERKFERRAIPNSSVVVAGEVSDEDLRALYSSCALFVFPSLYEGFGIPLLEAMACGAATIAGNNSSLPEVVNLAEALFDAANPRSIAAAMTAVLTNNGLRLRLSEYGLKRSRDFTWQNTALRTLEAMRELHARYRRTSTAVSVSSRRKLAYVSPLPPSATGIAEYTRELLPHLSRYFDIDLFAETSSGSRDDFISSNFRIYDFRELASRYDDYEATIYQFGNSPFHTFMVDLIESCPGVVVLHDFFLSNLAYDLEFIRGEPGAFAREIDSAHGLRGLIDFVAFGHAHARKHWPINTRILRAATAVLLHSKHQLKLFKHFSGHAWSPRLEFVSPPRALELSISLAERTAARASAAVPPECILVCSFGFLATTKRCQLIVEGFARAFHNSGRPMRLVFVGADDGGPYRQRLLEAFERNGVAEQCSITGFVDPETYRLYLRSADIAVQLRTDSRGESSRTVLDCLAHGLPTIVNSYGSLADLDRNAVLALAPDPSCEELAVALQSLAGDEQLRRNLATAARAEIATHHAPALVAAQYRGVLEAASRDDERNVVRAIGLANRAQRSLNSEALARTIGANDQVRQFPRLLVDVTRIASSDLHSGIERVVSSLIREFVMHAEPSLAVEVFRLEGRVPLRACRYAERIFSLSAGRLGDETEIEVRPGDRLLMLDSSWAEFERFNDLFVKVRSAGGIIVGVVYDLIPVRYPHYCHEHVLTAFEPWLQSMIRESDRVICISRSVADDLESYLEENGTPQLRRPFVTFAHLGSDVGGKSIDGTITPELSSFVDRSKSVFVMVGTIEPRKGHSTVLEAFDRLWQRGAHVSLIVIGREGWNVTDVMAAFRGHRELGQKLLLLESATDADVRYSYERATANICASAIEGFGLPIVESARHGTPSILSDIPVFREIGGHGAAYFPCGDAIVLADRIDSLARMTPDKRSELASLTPTFTWERAAANWVSAVTLPVQLKTSERKAVMHASLMTEHILAPNADTQSPSATVQT